MASFLGKDDGGRASVTKLPCNSHPLSCLLQPPTSFVCVKISIEPAINYSRLAHRNVVIDGLSLNGTDLPKIRYGKSNHKVTKSIF